MLFSDFLGQEEIKNYLKKSIIDDNISHSYIFEGKNGIGKYNLAMTFAQSLLCENYDDEPCNCCDSCIQVMSGNNPDIHILSPKERSIKREDIDKLRESISIKPYQSKRKIYIIKNSDSMTLQAANTFLKTLEEPTGNAVIIMLTTNKELLLPTIQSRCQVLTFKSLSNEVIAEHISHKYNMTKDNAELVAFYSEGVLSRAERIATGEDSILEKRLDVFDIFDKIIVLDKYVLFQYENYFDKNKENIEEIIHIIMILLRDIYFKKYNLDLHIVNKDFSSKISKYTEKFNTEKIDDMMIYLENVLFDIDSNVNYKLVIDNMLLKLQEGVN